MKLKYANLKRIGFALFLTLTITVSYAETKVIRCEFSLEESEVNDFSNKPGCPSGSDDIGKPWRTDTYTFNFKSFSKYDAVPVKIEVNRCSGNNETIYRAMNLKPTYITVYYFDRFAHHGHELTINTETLVGIDGEKCEQIQGEKISHIKLKIN